MSYEARILYAEEAGQREANDNLVALVRGVIEARRVEQCYGRIKMSDGQAVELARAIVTNLLAGNLITEIK